MNLSQDASLMAGEVMTKVTLIEAREGLRKTIAYVRAQSCEHEEFADYISTLSALLQLLCLQQDGIKEEPPFPGVREEFKEYSMSSTNNTWELPVFTTNDDCQASRVPARANGNEDDTPNKDGLNAIGLLVQHPEKTSQSVMDVGDEQDDDGKYDDKQDDDEQVDEQDDDVEAMSDGLQDALESSEDEEDKNLKGSFKCRTCERVFHYKQSYQRHLNRKVCLVPKEKLDLTCGICNRKFLYVVSFEKHCKSCVGLAEKKTWVCSICDREFHHPTPYNTHFKACQRKKSMPANVRPVKVKSNLDEPTQCSTCNKMFPNRRSLWRHMLRKICGAKREGCKVCTICNKSYNYLKGLERHLEKEHAGTQPYRCLACDKIFISVDEVENHMSEHSEAAPCECTTCRATFPQLQDLCEHVKSAPVTHMHNKSYMCEICGITVKDRKVLYSHTASHALTGEKNHQCKICNKRFNTPGNLKQHIKIHSDEKPHMCSVCGVRYRERSKLKIHMRVHTGERPYVCKVCGKSYRRGKALGVHERIHTGERPYICRTCGKTFADPDTLVLHNRLHSGVKPYTCSVCGKSFRRTYTLKVHKKTHKTLLNTMDSIKSETLT